MTTGMSRQREMIGRTGPRHPRKLMMANGKADAQAADLSLKNGAKMCTRCETVKPHAEFSPKPQNRDGRDSWCRPCKNEYLRQYRVKNADHVREKHMRNRYGVSLGDYDAMVAAQGGVCAVCNLPNRQHDKRNGTARRLHIDHDHATGRVRGLLCHHCNATLGHVDDDPERLRALAAYLESNQ